MATKKPQVTATLENKLYTIGNSSLTTDNNNATITGYIRYASTGEPSTRVSIYIINPKITVVTDQSGSYSLTLPKDKNELNIRGIGLKTPVWKLCYRYTRS